MPNTTVGSDDSYCLFYNSATTAECFTYKVLKIHHTVLENKKGRRRGAVMMNNN